MGIWLLWVQFERMNPNRNPYIQLEEVNGLKQKIFLIAS